MSPAGKPALRDAITSLVVIGLLTGFGTLVWWTRYPESAALTALREWPLVGGLAGALQDRYLPTPAEAPSFAGGTSGGESMAGDSTPVFELVYEPREPRPYVWVQPGARLYVDRSLSSVVGVELDAITNLFVEEKRDGWLRVRHRGTDLWIPEADTRAPSPAGNRPAPVLPLAGRTIESEPLDRASELMSTPAHAVLGGYSTWSDADPESLRLECDSAIRGLDDFFRDRLGLDPVGEAAETLLVFSSKQAYDAFSGQRRHSLGHAHTGYAATFVGDRPPANVCGTLLHEIAHLLTRRAIGPALPPWLGEGIAEFAEWDASSQQAPIGQVELARERGYLPDLESLVPLDETAFQDTGPPALNYTVSGLWIEYLLADAMRAERFRAFLRYLSLGGPWGSDPEVERLGAAAETPDLGDDLLHFLDSGYQEIDAAFRLWLWSGR